MSGAPRHVNKCCDGPETAGRKQEQAALRAFACAASPLDELQIERGPSAGVFIK